MTTRYVKFNPAEKDGWCLVRAEESWPPGHRSPGKPIACYQHTIRFEKYGKYFDISSKLVFMYPDGKLSVNRWVLAKALKEVVR